MASYDNNSEQNPFEDSTEFGSTLHQTRDLIDLQNNNNTNAHQPFLENASSSSTLKYQELPAPAYVHQQSPFKRNDSSFALDEGKEKKIPSPIFIFKQ
jgi:hypothetical protein